MFHRYALRTTDLESARRFYAEVLGFELPDGMAPTTALEAWPLHERARSMGVPSHWLFYFPVPDLDAALARVRSLGGTALDPLSVPRFGARLAACEDPQGATFGLASGIA